MGQSGRPARLGEQIQRELATLLSTEVKDPRLRLVTVTSVDLSPDMRHARVLFTALEAMQGRKSVLQGLEKSTGFLRARLGELLRIRLMPQLHFVFDDSVERGARISCLIDAALGSKSNVAPNLEET